MKTLLIVTLAVCIQFAVSRFWGQSLCLTEFGLKLYNTGETLCCNRRLAKRVGNQECCGLDVIDADKELCCGDVAHPLFNCSHNGHCREQSCCGSEVIFTNQSLCCNGHPIKLTEDQKNNNQFLQCCGNYGLIDTRYDMCCGNQKINRSPLKGCCDGKQFFTQLQLCVDVVGGKKIIDKDEKICGNDKYKITKQSCCAGVLNSSVPEMDPDNILTPNPHFGCCGTKVMDPTREKCCRADQYGFPTHTIPNHPDNECCAYGYFNKTCQECTGGQAVQKPPGQRMRCGARYIDLDREGCCASHQPYDLLSQKCCLGGHSSIIQTNQTCCNGEGVRENQLCCHNIKPCTKVKPDDDDCCYNYITHEGHTFNKQRQRCINGDVFHVSQPNMEVCGNKEYNSENSVLAGASSGNDQCCGSEPFNSRKQSCCCNRIFDVPSDISQCCHIDCKAHLDNDTTSACVGKCPVSGKPYNVNRETCCDGVVHRYRGGATCCGPFYGRKFKGCCAGRFPLLSRRPFVKCCDDKELFNSKTSRCLNGKVELKQKGLSDTQGVCHRPLLNSVDGVVEQMCTNQHALIGKLGEVKLFRRAAPETAVVQMTLTRVKALQTGLEFHPWTGPRSLTFVISVPLVESINCNRAFGRKSRKVVVFFSAGVRGKTVNIGAEDHIRVVRAWVVRKVRVSEQFCEDIYPNRLFASAEVDIDDLI